MYPLIVRLNNSDNIKEKLKQLSRDNFYTSEEPVVKIDTTIGDKILNLISIVCCLVTIISSIIINVLVFAKNKEKQQKKYVILKTLGYSRVDNIKSQYLEATLCLIVTILLMLLINGVITYIFQNYILENEAMLYGLKLISSSLNI